MTSQIYPINHLKSYKYVVILSTYHGRILLSRHKSRFTWETQGGHIEPGETPLQAARRELYEESGALSYDISPLFDYQAEDRIGGTCNKANGMVFHAEIHKLGSLPHSEMAEVREFDSLPEDLTYPEITPVLFQKYWNH
ncbi:MAG: NUDIX domain-containing protein [Eubacteriales bacterium]|nr:NUDIX domain-containing protein [Eubacteriales bacterium]